MSDEADDKTRLVRRAVPEPVEEPDDATRVVRRSPAAESAVPEPVEWVEGPLEGADLDATRLVERPSADETVAIQRPGRHSDPRPAPELPDGRTAFVPGAVAGGPIARYDIRELPTRAEPVIRSVSAPAPPRARAAAKRRGSRLGTIALVVVPVLVIAGVVAVVAWLVLR